MESTRPTAPDRLSRVRRRVRRAVLRRRRLLVAVFVAIAVAAGLQAVAGPQPETRRVLVPARDLAAGHRLAEADLESRVLPAATLPSGVVVDPRGETLATPVRRGEPVTDVRLSRQALLTSYPHLAALPVRIPDAGAAALLSPGDLVDVLATDPEGGGTRLLLSGAPVLALPSEAAPVSTAAGGLGGRLVVLGVLPTQRESVANAMVREFLTLSLSG